MASATFLDLLQIWPDLVPLDPEIASKIKYAKFHALRIAKALKVGEDPNLSNPTTGLSPGGDISADHLGQSEVQSLNGATGNDTRRQDRRQPSVEDVLDDHDRVQRSLAQRSSLDESLHPSRASSIPPQSFQHGSAAGAVSPAQPISGEDYYTNAAQDMDVSPLQASSADRKVSDGAGYFPRAPDLASDTGVSHRQLAPPGGPPSHFIPDSAVHPPASTASASQDLRPTDAFQSFPSLSVEHPNTPHQPHPEQKFTLRQQPNAAPQLPNPNIHEEYRRQIPQQLQSSVLQPQSSESANVPGDLKVDEEAIMKAQKHARWAISALNFEDTKTAVLELRGALAALGARNP